MLFFIIYIFVLLLFYAPPILLTALNIKNKPLDIHHVKLTRENICLLTMFLGFAYSALLFVAWGPKDYQIALVEHPLNFGAKYHTPIALVYMPTFLLFIAIGIIGYIILLYAKNRMPPLFMLLCICSLYIGMATSIIFIIQLSKNLCVDLLFPADVPLMALLPLNYIICSARQIRIIIHTQVEMMKNEKIEYNNFILKICGKWLSSSLGLFFLSFVLLLPFCGILLLILILFGQQPDAIVKMFTETSDWALSQKTSPPMIEYSGHYLCTVALRGHKEIVKPTRCGIRYGEKIIVNRQLCVANAFEEFIHEKYPKFHHKLRSFYDHNGYPLAKKIKTPWQADVIYILMKPAEYFFVLFLYLFDGTPENRIALQYTKR